MNFSGFSEKMEFSPVFDSATLLHSYFVWGEDTPDRERAARTLCGGHGMLLRWYVSLRRM